MVRATISFLAEHHAALEEIARRKKVSLSWVVRDAAEEYVRRHAMLGMKGQR
jgi:predicted transcriptional regulator